MPRQCFKHEDHKKAVTFFVFGVVGREGGAEDPGVRS